MAREWINAERFGSEARTFGILVAVALVPVAALLVLFGVPVLLSGMAGGGGLAGPAGLLVIAVAALVAAAIAGLFLMAGQLYAQRATFHEIRRLRADLAMRSGGGHVPPLWGPAGAPAEPQPREREPRLGA